MSVGEHLVSGYLHARLQGMYGRTEIGTESKIRISVKSEIDTKLRVRPESEQKGPRLKSRANIGTDSRTKIKFEGSLMSTHTKLRIKPIKAKELVENYFETYTTSHRHIKLSLVPYTTETPNRGRRVRRRAPHQRRRPARAPNKGAFNVNRTGARNRFAGAAGALGGDSGAGAGPRGEPAFANLGADSNLRLSRIVNVVFGLRRFEILYVGYGLKAKIDMGVPRPRSNNNTPDEVGPVPYKVGGDNQAWRTVALY
ncbi:hypothetical protein EVAR_57398_1 [Eumeta japonica]|uniref:Uncharacterized protein n=1 Tax=Eumeta variegata TaxID=151549 RepID=A0A4C1YDS8_EUMVA|nr:hypothetical protein EVAR_57398_1 [Eumeta japonica]